MTVVTLKNTPAMVTTSSPGSAGMAGSFNGYTPVFGDTLVAFAAAASASGTSILATAEQTGTTGWTKQFEVFNDTSADSNVVLAMWTLPASGGDAAPTFTASKSGSGSTAGAIVLAVLGNTSPAAWDTTGTFSSGSNVLTLSSETVTTSGNVSLAGDYALAALARQRVSVASAYSSSAWTNLAATSASSILQLGVDGLSGPSTGSAASDTGNWTGTSTSAFGAGIAVVFSVVTPPSSGSFFF